MLTVSMSTYLSCSFTVSPRYVFVSECVTVMVVHFSFSIHSLRYNVAISEVGREAVEEAAKLSGTRM